MNTVKTLMGGNENSEIMRSFIKDTKTQNIIYNNYNYLKSLNTNELKKALAKLSK